MTTTRQFQAPVDPKMPYTMLMGLRKKAKQREEQREAMEAEAGVVTGNAGSARRKSAQTPRGRGGGGGRGGIGGGKGGGGSDRGGGSSRCVLFCARMALSSLNIHTYFVQTISC